MYQVSIERSSPYLTDSTLESRFSIEGPIRDKIPSVIKLAEDFSSVESTVGGNSEEVAIFTAIEPLKFSYYRDQSFLYGDITPQRDFG